MPPHLHLGAPPPPAGRGLHIMAASISSAPGRAPWKPLGHQAEQPRARRQTASPPCVSPVLERRRLCAANARRPPRSVTRPCRAMVALTERPRLLTPAAASPVAEPPWVVVVPWSRVHQATARRWDSVGPDRNTGSPPRSDHSRLSSLPTPSSSRHDKQHRCNIVGPVPRPLSRQPLSLVEPLPHLLPRTLAPSVGRSSSNPRRSASV